MKKVLIIGAGAQRNVISGVLAKAAEVGEVMLADINIERAGEVAQYVGSDKIKTAVVNASDKAEVASLMKKGGYDLVFNATLMTFNRQILEGALDAGIHYLDMASNDFFTQKNGQTFLVEQLEYGDAFEKAGLTANILAGGDAGLVNIMAREAADELDEVDAICIKDYGVVTCDAPVAMWSFQTYLEDCYDEAVYWEDGQYKFAPPFSGGEDYYFPHPLNLTGKVFYHNHEEPVTLPTFLGKPVKYVDFKMWTDSPDAARACSLISGTNDVSWITSIPASILSLMILRGQLKRTGVFPCEVLDKEERGIFFKGIKEWDVRVHKQVTREMV